MLGVVPACPEWTAADLVAHCTGIPAALSAGDYPSGDQQAWLDGLVVASPRGVPIDCGDRGVVGARRGVEADARRSGRPALRRPRRARARPAGCARSGRPRCPRGRRGPAPHAGGPGRTAAGGRARSGRGPGRPPELAIARRRVRMGPADHAVGGRTGGQQPTHPRRAPRDPPRGRRRGVPRRARRAPPVAVDLARRASDDGSAPPPGPRSPARGVVSATAACT